jgi:XTP/dITP diphosphohydrolase
LSNVLFASSNENKYKEAKAILSKFDINLEFFKCHLEEIQADTLEEVALHKVTQAFLQCSKPVIIEDDGLFIESLNGFPGPYSAFAYKTIGNKGILSLLKTKRNAKFQSVIAYCERKSDVMLFKAAVDGKISKKLCGTKWGYDPIFIPDGQNKTYAQLKDKNLVSHRYLALRKFATWRLHERQSSGR